jgi:hypothetical protein
MSVQTIQKRILSQRQGDFVGEDEIIFDITPSDVAVLAGKNSYFHCEVILEAAGDTAAKASLDSFGGGGYSLFDRMQVWSGDGATLIENCEEVPCLMGTKNFYDKTDGLANQRHILEGLNDNDGTVPDDCLSPYYSMLPCDGDPHYQKVELILPLRFSGVMHGKVFPVVATQGLQVRFLLNSAVKACKADLCDGFIVQRDRQGRGAELQDLPYTTAQSTTAAAFVAPAATNPIRGPVPQQLPSLWQLAAGGGGGGSLTAGASLLASITQQTVGAAAAGYGGVATTTTTGTGSGCTLNVTVGGGGTVTAVAVLAVGSGYEVGSVISVASGLIGGGAQDLLITLQAGDLTPTVGLTSIHIMKTGAVGVPTAIPNLKSNILATNDTFANLKGQRLYALDDAGALIELTANSPTGITAVDATNAAYIKVDWAGATTGHDKFTAANNPCCGGAIIDPNVSARAAQVVSYRLQNVELVCESVAEQGYVAAMMARVKSQGGLSLDIKTYNVLRQNLFKNQVVSQQLIPTTTYRAKALLQHQQIPFENLGFSYYQPVSDYLRQYQYMIKDKNTPNRKVSVDEEYSPELNTWNVLADSERTKTLEAFSVDVRRETHPAARFVFGRELAKAGYSFNANKNQCRLTQDWGITVPIGAGATANVVPQFDKLLLTLVPHFRKVTMSSDNVVVAF